MLLVIGPLSAQMPDSLSNPIIADGYIERMNSYLGAKLSLYNDVEGFTIHNSSLTCRVRPNTYLTTRFSLSYRFISLAVGLHPKFLASNRDEDEKGKSDATNINLNLSFNHWNQSLSYEKNKGYYVDQIQSTDEIPISDSDSYIQLPNMTYWSIGGSTSYKINEKLSLRAYKIQTDRQLKSAGSFMPTLSYRYFVIDTQDTLPGQDVSKRYDNFEMVASISYYYTKVFKRNLYITGGLEPGIGLSYNKIIENSPSGKQSDSYFYPIYKAEAELALGYNSRRFFCGAQAFFSLGSYNPKNANSLLINDNSTYQIFFGYRFNAPKKVKTLTDKAEETGTKILEEIH